MRGIIRASLVVSIVLLIPVLASAGPPTVGAAAGDAQTAVATGPLVREIQFMLLSLGFDPGPLDGNAQQLTNRAVRAFQQRSGLPVADLVNERPVPPEFLERLRKEVAQNLLKGTKPEPEQQAAVAPPAPPPPAPPAPEVAPAKAAPPAPPPDRFASCSYNPQDFLVGGKQYTPESFLDEGFGGATPRAVANLRQRLDEARQIAEKIGGPALLEVQRQARVLAYFECRQKIEQASAEKN
jgi:peptidoglycan hydrolase-like protein with peptidoglycan-binding domain